MISRFLLALGLAVLMLFSGVTSYIVLGGRHSKINNPPQNPVAATPTSQAFRLPGTMYLVQNGAIYSLAAGRFHQLTPEAGWMQPSLYPDNSRLIAVRRLFYYSDVYILNRFGRVLKQVTSNNAPPRNTDTGARHWSFYPRLAKNGQLFMSYDSPKYGYEVDMSVWSMPIGGNIRQGRIWTNSNGYSGGDMQPVPLSSGGAILYTKFGFGTDTKLGSQIWYSNRAGSYGRAVTAEGANCMQPAVSPSGRQVAMVCNYGKQISYLMVASFNGSSFGPLKAVITNQMVAQPAWAPDGSGIAYFAPAVGAGPFQLWFLPAAAYTPPAPSPSPIDSPSPAATPVPVKPIQLTAYQGFDATSPIAWAP